MVMGRHPSHRLVARKQEKKKEKKTNKKILYPRIAALTKLCLYRCNNDHYYQSEWFGWSGARGDDRSPSVWKKRVEDLFSRSGRSISAASQNLKFRTAIQICAWFPFRYQFPFISNLAYVVIRAQSYWLVVRMKFPGLQLSIVLVA